MLIVLLDEPVLFVFPSACAAERTIEPIDAESEIRAAFDDQAVPYRVEWVHPNRRRKSVLGIEVVDQGVYRLVPAGSAQPALLAALLESHPETDPPEAKAEIVSLLMALKCLTEALQPTPATGPNEQPDTAGSGRRG